MNLGNPDEITIMDLAREVIELAGSSSDIALKPLPQDDPTRRRPDITRAREKLDWEPEVGRSEGLALTLDDFRKRIG